MAIDPGPAPFFPIPIDRPFVPRMRPYGLLVDEASTILGLPDRWIAGVTWAPLGCAVPSPLPQQCYYVDDLLVQERPEDFAAFSAFWVNAGESCSTMSWESSDLEARSAERLTLFESEQIAHELMLGETTGNPSLTSSAVTATGTALVITDVVPFAEKVLAAELHGMRGMLHVAVELLAYLKQANAVEFLDGKWVTPGGHVVVADPGYLGWEPDGDPPAAGKSWAYTSGPVGVKTGEAFRSKRSENTDVTTNTQWAFVQRPALVVFEQCGVTALQVTLPTALPAYPGG